MKQYRSDHARRIFREVLNEVEYGGEHVEILRYTTPSAVIVPEGWYKRASAALEQEYNERSRDDDTTAAGDIRLPA